MPKMKTKRGAAKRMKRTKNGGIKCSRAFGKKSMTGKSAKRKRHLGKPKMMDRADLRHVRVLMPYDC